jgi:hypothetical protein
MARVEHTMSPLATSRRHLVDLIKDVDEQRFRIDNPPASRARRY